MSATRWILCAMALVGGGCLQDLPPVPAVDHTPLAVGERREVELRYLRFDVVNYEKTLTRADILALPAATRSRLWLLDLDLRNNARAPRLLDNSIAAIRAADPSTLTPAARNLQRLLAMTPDTADLQGTSLAQLISLAPLLGIAPGQVLGDMMNVGVDREFITPDVIAQAILENVIATHPNARMRPGPVTPDNPRGLYPVAPGALPVTLEDAASDFATLSQRFGPVSVDGVYHPGFITGEVRARVLTDAFRMKVRANANALPYRGLDLTDASDGAVNPIASQIGGLFDFTDPNWLQLEGLVPGEARIDAMTFRVVEWDGFVRGGRSPIPTAQGDSAAWTLPPWTLERVLMTAGQRAFAMSNANIAYAAPGRTDALFRARVTNGWQELFVEGGLGSPPAPSYLWDILLEVAQVRLHDGGLAEGMAGVEVALRDVRTGVDAATLERTIRHNLEADPAALSELATSLIDNSAGATDFYYYRPRASTSPDDDYLYFVNEGDIGRGRDGNPTRMYRYRNVGFYSDMGLTRRVSTTTAIDGDADHQKVRLRTGMTLFCADDDGRTYRLDVGAKPSLNRRRITVTRVGVVMRARVLVTLALTLASGAASAQALTSPNVGTGLSGAATADPAAVWWNPAMLGFLDRPTILIGGSLIAGHAEYTRERRATYQRADGLGFALPVSAQSLDASRTGVAPTATANPIAASPTAFLAVPIAVGSSRLVASLGVYSPYAALLQFDPDGAQRWQLQSATIVTAYVTPTLTWRISDAVSVGAGVSYVFGFAELAKMQDFAALGDVGAALARPPISQRNDFGPNAPPGVRELDVLARPIRLRQMTAHGFTFNAGLALRPVRGLTIGLSYQHSTELTFAGRFELDLNDPFFTRDLASQGLQFAPRVEGEATLSFPLPRAVRAAVSYDVSPLVGFGVTAEYVTWSQVEQFDARVRSPQLAQPALGLADAQQLALPRRWRDTIAVEGTLRVSPWQRVMLWVTGGYHSSASPDETLDVASPDGDRIVAAAGARVRVGDQWTLLGDVEVQTIVPRTVVGSDNDLGNGEYRLTLVNVGAHVMRAF